MKNHTNLPLPASQQLKVVRPQQLIPFFAVLVGFAVVWKMDKIVDTGPEKGHRLHILPTFPTRPGDDAQPNYSHTHTRARAYTRTSSTFVLTLI